MRRPWPPGTGTLLRRNLPYKVVALGMAGVLYGVASAQQNPRTQRDFSVTPVVRGLPGDLLVTGAPKSLFVTVSGPASALRVLPPDGPQTWLDASGARPGTLRLAPRYDLPDLARGRVEVRAGRPAVELRVERRLSRTFDIDTPPLPAALGFSFKPAVVTPAQVQVSGPQSQVERVRRVLARIEPTRGDASVSGTFNLVAQDERRQLVQSVRIAPPQASVRLELTQATATKAVLVSANLTGQEAPGFQVYDAQIEPHTVSVTGLQDRLMLLSGLSVLVDVQNARQNTTRTATPVLPAGVRFAPGTSGRVSVRLRVRPVRSSGNLAAGGPAPAAATNPATPPPPNGTAAPPPASTGSPAAGGENTPRPSPPRSLF